MYGLIGKSLTHSFSANYFNKKFAEEGVNEKYLLLPIPSIKDFPSLLNSHPDLRGLNVTMPYKQEIIPYLNKISKEASEIGAVNVIKIEREKDKIILTGYNTDYIGFENSLKPLLNHEIKKALILGSGGASNAVKFVLKRLNISYTVVSRSPGQDKEISYVDLTEKIIRENLLIINTTPLGMYPNENFSPPIPYQFLTDKHICYDLIYNPPETLFLKISKDKGATIKNGEEMLIIQAEESRKIWKV